MLAVAKWDYFKTTSITTIKIIVISASHFITNTNKELLQNHNYNLLELFK